MRLSHSLAAAAIALGLGTLAAVPAHARLLDSARTCASEDHGHQFCHMPTRHGIHIVRQLSSRPCVRGRTYFVTYDGVNVRNGCRAIFMPNRARRPNTGL